MHIYSFRRSTVTKFQFSHNLGKRAWATNITDLNMFNVTFNTGVY